MPRVKPIDPEKFIHLAAVTEVTPVVEATIKYVFDQHAWDEEQKARGARVRQALENAFRVILEDVEPSADRSCALRKVREATMDAYSGITHGGRY